MHAHTRVPKWQCWVIVQCNANKANALLRGGSQNGTGGGRGGGGAPVGVHKQANKQTTAPVCLRPRGVQHLLYLYLLYRREVSRSQVHSRVLSWPGGHCNLADLLEPKICTAPKLAGATQGAGVSCAAVTSPRRLMWHMAHHDAGCSCANIAAAIDNSPV